MAAVNYEETAILPFDIVKRSVGFSLDIGGSAAKIVYRDKRDWDDAKNEPKQVEGGFAHVRTAVFLREKLDDVINFIHERCKITRSGDERPTVVTTGFGCHLFGQEIEEKLNIRIKVVTEMDCFIKAFNLLRHSLPTNQLCHDVPPKALQKACAIKEGLAQMAINMEQMKLSKAKFKMLDVPEEEQKTELSSDDVYPMFPCLLGTLGSAFAFMKVEADESFEFSSGSNRGGRYFLGLGSLLTGAKSFDELLQLAEKGDSSKVHQFVAELQLAESTNDMYAQMPKNHLAFCFGNAVNKTIDDFRREDLAAALLQQTCIDATQVVETAYDRSGCRVLYLTGGFGESPLVRECLTEWILSRTLMGGLPMDCVRFVKHGGHLGAVGAFMQGAQQASDQQNGSS